MYTANTMSSALEVLGVSLPYSSSTPALYPGSCWAFYLIISYLPVVLGHEEKAQECYKAAKYLKNLLEIDLKPKFVLTFYVAFLKLMNVLRLETL